MIKRSRAPSGATPHGRRQIPACACWKLLLLVCVGCGDSDVARLAQLLSDADHEVRYDAVKALEKQGPAAAAAVPALATTLADSDSQVRYRSAKVLSKIGFEAAPAAGALARALDQSLLGTKGALAGKHGNVQDEANNRYYLVKALANLDGEAQPALEGLIRTLQHDADPRTRYYAAKALGKIGGSAQAALPALEKARKDSDKKVSQAAEQALTKIQPH